MRIAVFLITPETNEKTFTQTHSYVSENTKIKKNRLICRLSIQNRCVFKHSAWDPSEGVAGNGMLALLKPETEFPAASGFTQGLYWLRNCYYIYVELGDI